MKDVYAEVTARIIEQLEQGVIPWRKPWITSGAAISHSTGKPYSLLNQILLTKPGEYVTFNQITADGGHVKKGAKSSMVVFWKWIETEDEDNPGETKKIPFLRYYNVFHIDQTEGIKPKYSKPLPNVAQPDEAAEAIVRDYLTRSGVRLIHDEGDRAFYRPSTDSITLPLLAQFKDAAEYYSTLFHEMTHSTGHHSRLDLLTKVAAFGSEDYSKEELIAEIGAATLVNYAGLETSGTLTNSAAYIQSWLKAMQDDKRLIVSASGKAEKAVNLILNR